MNQLDLVNRVYALTRDFNQSIFRQSDIIDFLNEGIDRVSQVIPEIGMLNPLVYSVDVPNTIPPAYHSLLAQFATSRCFSQDDRPYQAITFSNEFEQKLDEFRNLFENGRIILTDASGNAIKPFNAISFTRTDDYFYEGRVLFNTPTPAGGLDNNTVAFDNITDEDGDINDID